MDIGSNKTPARLWIYRQTRKGTQEKQIARTHKEGRTQLHPQRKKEQQKKISHESPVSHPFIVLMFCPLVYRHPRWHGLGHARAHLCHAVLVLLVRHFPLGDVRLEAFVEIHDTGDRVDDRQDDEQDGDHGESSQTSSSRLVRLFVVLSPHAHQLEDEVCQRSEQDEHNTPHHSLLLPASEERSGGQEGNGDWQCGNGDIKLIVLPADDATLAGGEAGSGRNDDDELNGEANEEEEVELQESDENLEGEVTLLHAKVGTDMLVDAPCKLIVQLPADNAHENSRKCDHTRNSDEERSNGAPNVRLHKLLICVLGLIRRQGIIGIIDLVHLNGGIDEHRKVEDADTDDLDRVLKTEGIVAKSNQENMGEDK